ncbi:MAG: 4Fe-4S binding protein, partial [Gammaproteobacteria bacterium]|nr:4Fe-4S binding protein [Gammaproteobacteria bacterium]
QDLPVVDEDRCTACGDCVTACPKDLFSLQRADDRVFVACRSQLAGDEMLEDCAVGCTACGKCAMDSSAITMVENLPVIDYARRPTRDAIDRCPTGAIVWFDPADGPLKGRSARKIIRHAALKDAST